MILAALTLAIIACESDVTMDETPQPTPHVSARQHLVHEAAGTAAEPGAPGRLVVQHLDRGEHERLPAAKHDSGILHRRVEEAPRHWRRASVLAA